MKLSRKLIPAFIMLLVSAVLMSTASFAWFSTNTSATVSGVNVKISSATTLLIKDAQEDATKYATSKTYALQNTSMAPLSAATPADATDVEEADDMAVPTFFKLTAANGILPNSTAYTENSTFAAEAEATNYLTETINLRATGDTLGKLMLKVGVSDAATEINKSLRVMVAVYDPDAKTVTWFRCSPFGGAAIEPIATLKDDGKVETLGAEEDLDANMVGENGTELVAAVKAETEYTVSFYAWFEGQDATCYANNAVGLQAVGITFTFSLA